MGLEDEKACGAGLWSLVVVDRQVKTELRAEGII